MLSSILQIVLEVSKKRITWIITTILLFLALLFFIFTPPVDLSPFQDRINLLEEQIQDLQKKDLLLSQEVDSLKHLENSLIEKNLVLQSELVQVQTAYDEKIYDINTSTVDELTEFFTDRYRHLLRSTP